MPENIYSMLIIVAGREEPVAHHESLAETGESPEIFRKFLVHRFMSRHPSD